MVNSREKWGKVGEKEMGSFRGLHTASLDQKGRLNLPSKFRKQFTPEADDMVVLMKTDLPCLLLFPQDVFSNFEQEILAKRKESSAAGRMSRKLMSSIDEEKLDKHVILLEVEAKKEDRQKDIDDMHKAGEEINPPNKRYPL